MVSFKPDEPVSTQSEGTVSYTVGRTTSDVIIEFSNPVKWVALSPKGARELAHNLRKMADEISKLSAPTHTRQRGRRRRRKP